MAVVARNFPGMRACREQRRFVACGFCSDFTWRDFPASLDGASKYHDAAEWRRPAKSCNASAPAEMPALVPLPWGSLTQVRRACISPALFAFCDKNNPGLK